jgi:hypothetical protein
MGKMKALAMDMEEQFIDKCGEIAGECETFAEYVERAVLFDNLVIHLDKEEVADIISETWDEFWSKHR